MVQPREKTFHELLRQTQKIPRPEVHDFLFPSLSHRIGFFCHLCGLQLMMNWGWTSFLINVILFCLTNLLQFLLCNSVIFMIFFCIVICSSRASSQRQSSSSIAFVVPMSKLGFADIFVPQVL
jgi:hypothetical protein